MPFASVWNSEQHVWNQIFLTFLLLLGFQRVSLNSQCITELKSRRLASGSRGKRRLITWCYMVLEVISDPAFPFTTSNRHNSIVYPIFCRSFWFYLNEVHSNLSQIISSSAESRASPPRSTAFTLYAVVCIEVVFRSLITHRTSDSTLMVPFSTSDLVLSSLSHPASSEICIRGSESMSFSYLFMRVDRDLESLFAHCPCVKMGCHEFRACTEILSPFHGRECCIA